MSPQPLLKGRRLFLSYGHRDATELALRVRSDLETAGYPVWQDESRIRAGSAWTDEIRQGLRESDLVIALLSPHAVRRAGWGPDPGQQDSVCLDEIEYAVDACRIPVLPVMAVSCEPPFRIYRLQYLDFRAWEESEARYKELKKTLITSVADCLATGRAPLRKWDRLPEPWDFTAFLAERRRRFMGRTWLFDELQDRVENTASPVILLTGSPGIGKSAFFASLVHSNPDGQILAYHCCQATTPATLSPAVFVRSIAAMIAARDASYAGLLEHPETLAMLNEATVAADPASAFEVLILNLLHKLPEPEAKPRLLIIDGLDEALAWPGSPNLLDLLSTRIGALPAWLKIVGTTRDEPPVKRRFRTATLLSLDAAKQDNDRDLSAYVSARIEIEPLSSKVGARRQEIGDKVLARGTGNFLVVAQTLDAVESGLLDVDDLDALAPGLHPLYEGFFDRLFQRAGVDFTPSRTLLECILASQEPPRRSELADVTGLDAETDLAPLLARMASLVPPRDGHYSPFHKTLTEWLTGWDTELDQPVAGAYYISTKRGHRLWANVLHQRYAKGPASWDVQLRRYLLIHLAGAEQWDEVAGVLLDLRFLEAKVRGPGTTVFDLVADFETTLRHMPDDHDRHRLVFLVSEILRLDATFLVGFPDSVFQCLWNRGHWHDCPHAKSFFDAPAASSPPWEHVEPRLSTLVEQWRIEKTTSSPAHAWLRALRPMPEALGGVQRGIIRADSDSFETVTVSPDGSRVMASISEKGLLGVWDVHSTAQLAQADFTDEKSVQCVRFFGGGPRIGLAAAVTLDGRLILLDDALQVVDQVQATENNFGRVALSPDGTVIATGDWNGAVALWAADTMTLLRRWQAHANEIKALEFSPCGQFLASGEQSYGDKSKVAVWAVAASDEHPLAEAKARDWVESVCFSEDGQVLYWGDYEGAIERWTWGSGERTLIRDEHDSPASVIRLLGEQRLLCGVGGASDPVPIEVWNLAEGTIEQNLNGHLFGVGDLAYIPGTQRFVSAGDSTLRIWDLGVPDAIRLTMLEPEVDWVAFREPQGWVITGTETSDTVWVRTLADGALVLRLQDPELVSAMALSHDGRWLASGMADGGIRLWDLESGQSTWRTTHHKEKVTDVVFSPDGLMLVTASEDGGINLIATEDGKLIKHSRGHNDDAVHSLAVSNNGRLVACGGYSNLEIRNVESLRVGRKLESVTHYALWFSPDDEYLVAEGMSQFGLAWKVATGESLSDGEAVRALYDVAMLRAGRPWQWHSPGNIGYAQEYLKLIDTRSGAAVAAFPELQGEVRWHPGGRIWVNKRSRQVSLVQLEGPQSP